jgi:hypothetical protein
MTLSGCVHIRAPQLTSISNFIQDNLETDTVVSQHWQLTIDDYDTEISFLTIAGQTLFVNTEQDIAVIDTFTINQLHLPRINDARIKIKDMALDNNILRTISVNDVLYESQECTAWQIVTADSALIQHYPTPSRNTIMSAITRNADDIKVRQQSCQGATKNIHTVVLKNDNIQHITQFIPYFNQYITISLL